MILEQALRRWRRQRLAALWAEGGLRLAALAAGCALAAWTAERLLSPSPAGRWLVFAAAALAVLAGLAAFLLAPLPLLRARAVLACAARAFPELKEHLLSAWELSRVRVPANCSAELAAEHVRRAEALVEGLAGRPLPGAAPSRAARRQAGWVAAAWGLGLPWLYRDPGALGRALAPWREASIESMAEVRPGDARLPWGEAAAVEVRWRGAGRPRLLLRGAGAWGEAPWDAESRGRFSYRIDALTHPVEYRLEHQGRRGRTYRLTPVQPPRLAELTALVRAPGRADAREVSLEEGGGLSALRGSWIEVRGRPEVPLREARLVLAGEPPVPMRRLPSGLWSGGFALGAGGSLRVEAVGEDGSTDPAPVSYALEALEDRPPEVELVSPAFELEIAPRESLEVSYSAKDDSGLRSVSLRWSADGGPEREAASRRLEGEEDAGELAWDLSGVAPGARVEFWLRVEDDARPRGQAGESRRGVLRVVDFEAAHRLSADAWSGAEEALRALSRREGEARAASADPAGRSPAALERLERDLERAWQSAERGARRLESAVQGDPYANPGMARAAEAVAGLVSALREGEAKRAREAARAGRWEEAERRHAALEKRAGAAADLLGSGRELQATQDFWADAERMDRAASELEGALGDLASGKAPSEEARRRLGEALAELQKGLDELARSVASLPKADPESERGRRRSAYSLPLEEARRSSEELSAALARGDYAEAARVAKRLAEQIGRMRSALSQAARGQAEQAAGSERLERAFALWKEVVEGQTRALQMSQALEAGRQKSRLEAQKKLLAELAAEQAAAIKEADGLGSAVPADAAGWMREVLQEFEKAEVREAPRLLESVIGRLAGPERLAALAGRERAVLERLRAGVPDRLEEGALSEGLAARAVQSQVRRRTGELEAEVSAAAREAAAAPAEAAEAARAAQLEQSAAEEALGRGDGGGAAVRQAKALEILEQGAQRMAESLERQREIERSSAASLERPRGGVRVVGPATTGADTAPVPIPGAEEYQPPREIRREVERALRERRPKVFDETVDQYLRRMSE